MFKKVLIANRGAIATRIERTLARMGVASVAVYSEADRDSLHVERADEAVCLGAGSAAETYLDPDKVIAAAKSTGAEAVHPGYGFLSESVAFAQACERAGIVFIGPSPDQIERFGLKHVARGLAKRAGVPLLSGTGLITDEAVAAEAAQRIGYPVMLKSTAGGGGIGMRVCRTPDDLASAFDAVRHLAQANFGDAGVFLEKYIERARHVEVQIFGTADDVVAVAERDCSVQRRNQKVVEETPAPNLPPAVRTRILRAAEEMARSVGYRSAGTVEFLYDESTEEFYFLEVNTRLQVEHGITEECSGIDLVEWMVREAAGELSDVRSLVREPQGCAIEVRVYAEDPYRGFLPATGKIDAVEFPSDARVETWVRKGVEITSLYDPMIAKIIVHADTRDEAQAKMRSVLARTRVYGVTTNVQFLQALFERDDYRKGRLATRMLDGFAPAEAALEVLDGGIQSSVQDYPGFTGYWAVGVPPCGPMDMLSFRLANALLGNDEGAPGIEMTMKGGAFRFRCDTAFALAGAPMPADLDGEPVSAGVVLRARAGQVLTVGACETGMRTYLCVAGGLDVPRVLGSASTFIDGRFGGHGGRALKAGDVIRLAAGAGEPVAAAETADGEAGAAGAAAVAGAPVGATLPVACTPELGHAWTIGVLVGPQPTAEFLEPAYLDDLCTAAFTVNYDSARTGVRLNGPAPRWTREDGGEAGLHPSNVHDNPYAIGALDLTGDQPILLGPDGPSLGGFVCPVVVAVGERWKLGQLRPGDTVRFQLLAPAQATALREGEERTIAAVAARSKGEAAGAVSAAAAGAGTASAATAPASPAASASDSSSGETAVAAVPALPVLPEPAVGLEPADAILHDGGESDERIVVRRSGEDAVLVEYGPMKLDITLRFRVHVLMQALEDADPAIVDLTPGIRSLQIHFDPAHMTAEQACELAVSADASLPPLEDVTVPSRIVHLPLSWDDPQTQLAARRYQETTRPDAPWCPSNPEFIRRINGLDSIDDVRDIVFDADYLVLGLGDVYLGAPVATPVDPRHRLVTTKYNPARPWTPENAVGIGGAYLCVYGMEGPGGYQFVGRTTQMWNPLEPTATFKPGKPWLLNFFDQLRFYPVSADEILKLRDDCLRGRFNVEIEETTFQLGDYLRFLQENEESIAAFKQHQEQAFEAEHERWVEQGLDTFVSDEPRPAFDLADEVPDGCAAVKASIAGAVWKVPVAEGAVVEAGETLAVLESMKMEFPLVADSAGTVRKLYVKPGETVEYGQLVAAVDPTGAAA
ncbi:MAG: 5-oxoprolinase/urea amidolyase family protein [Eggerthellaceae bacterium]|jgi:urea carboxylase